MKNICLWCDVEFKSVTAKKYCADCKIKAEALKKPVKKERYLTIKKSGFIAKEKPCEQCRTPFTPRNGGFYQITRRFCSNECQLIWNKNHSLNLARERRNIPKVYRNCEPSIYE